MIRTHPSHRALRTAAVAALVPVALLLSACGGGSTPSGAAAVPSGQARGNGGSAFGQGGAGSGFPGASGLIAAVSPDTLQVQGTDAQTTVTYGSSTRFTQVVTGKVADGDCVTVTGTPVSGDDTALTATSVQIEAKVNGACPTLGRFGSGSGNGNGAGGGFFGGASGSPRPRPSGAPSGSGQLGRDFAFAAGTVTAVSGSTVTVQGVLREPRTSASPSAQPTTPTSLTVTLSASTQVTATEAATSKAAVVGMCATAIGRADDRGDIAATSITVSKPDANGCRAGAGAFGFGRGGGTGGGAGSAAGSGSSG